VEGLPGTFLPGYFPQRVPLRVRHAAEGPRPKLMARQDLPRDKAQFLVLRTKQAKALLAQFEEMQAM
jgi:hypothetical protein